MEKLQNIRIISFLLAIGMMVISCVHDDDFSVPEINMEEPNVNVNTDIATVKAMYGGFDPVLIESGGGSTNEMYLEAYVISSDEAGNIYKQLYIQDTPQNPSAGVSSLLMLLICTPNTVRDKRFILESMDCISENIWGYQRLESWMGGMWAECTPKILKSVSTVL